MLILNTDSETQPRADHHEVSGKGAIATFNNGAARLLAAFVSGIKMRQQAEIDYQTRIPKVPPGVPCGALRHLRVERLFWKLSKFPARGMIEALIAFRASKLQFPTNRSFKKFSATRAFRFIAVTENVADRSVSHCSSRSLEIGGSQMEQVIRC